MPTATDQHNQQDPPTVRDLMRPAVTSIERDAHMAAAAYLMKQGHDTALVVIDDYADSRPIAVITEADIAGVVADGRDLNEVRISEFVTRAPITVLPDASIAEAAERMLSSHIRHLPVVDAGGLIGVLDISDACRGLLLAGVRGG